MPPTLLNPSFETDSDWTFAGVAGYWAGDAHAGTRSVLLQVGKAVFSVWGSASQTITGFQSGKLYEFSIYAKCETPIEDLPWTVSVAWPDGTTQVVIDAWPFQEADWTEYTGTFVSLGTSCVLTIATPNGTTHALQSILFDSGAVALQEDSMAVLLAERAVGQVLAALQHANGLETELTAIAGERGDGIVLNPPDRWYTAPRAELSYDSVSVEVFSDVTRFVDQEKRLPSWTVGVREAMPSEVDVTIRLTHANRDMASLPTMRKRTERYLAALARTLRNYPVLMDTSGNVRWAQLNEARTTTEDAIVDNENRVVVDRLTLSITVHLNEGASGEGESGGGTPPTYTISET